MAKGTTIETQIYLAVALGMRRGEIAGLRWNNVNFKEKTLLICETRVPTKQEIIVKPPKNESSIRTLILPEFLLAHLKKILIKQKENKLLLGNTYVDSKYICTYEDGRPITPYYLSCKWKDIIRESNLPSLRLHDLRHTAASYLLKQGASMKEVQEMLGHKQISTTFDIYAHLDIQTKRQSAEKMNKMFSTM